MRQHFRPCRIYHSHYIPRRRLVGRSEAGGSNGALVAGKRWRSWQAEARDEAQTKESPLRRRRSSPTGVLVAVAIVFGAATILGKYDPVRAFVEASMLRNPEAFADGFVLPLQARSSGGGGSGSGSGSGSDSTAQTDNVAGAGSLGANGATAVAAAAAAAGGAATDSSAKDASSGGSLQESALSAWARVVDSADELTAAITSFEWSAIPSTLTGLILPEWFRLLPGYITKLRAELAMTPGSLADEIWREANDADVNPEIAWPARVRVSDALCADEAAFLQRRRAHTRVALARYLGLDERDVDARDVPTIALCASGGGLRALLAAAGSYAAVHEAGLFDCVAYTAGVSGSCWMQALYYSTLGACRHAHVVRHVKARACVHLAFPPAVLALLTAAPTNKFLLRGAVEKMRADPDGSFGLVDVYGLLLAARLLVPKGELGVDERDLKLSNQRAYVDGGRQPLPIYTAVRHEIPLPEVLQATAENENAIVNDGNDGGGGGGGGSGSSSSSGGKNAAAEVSAQGLERAKKTAKEESWFQWFEFTPYELWCEELGAGIPAWAVGRQFDAGASVHGADGRAWPQLKMPQLLGMWGSAFCATLGQYYRELRPLLQGLAGFERLDQLIVGDSGNDNGLFSRVHPIEPAVIPNYLRGMRADQLPGTCPASVLRARHLPLMDAGISNNLPIYPLLRPGRDVDVIIAFDASAQVRADNWLAVTDGYARQRGVKGWPVGIGWPPPTPQEAARGAGEAEDVRKLDAAQAGSAEEADAKVAEARDRQQQEQRAGGKRGDTVAQALHGRPLTETGSAPQSSSSSSSSSSTPSSSLPAASQDLGHCTVWVGTTEERSSDEEPPPAKSVRADWELMAPNAGITVVYFPLIANERVPGILQQPDASPSTATTTTSTTAAIGTTTTAPAPAAATASTTSIANTNSRTNSGPSSSAAATAAADAAAAPPADAPIADFMSTWNTVYTPEQVDLVVALAQANFAVGRERTKATVRAAYARKKRQREEREAAAKLERRRRKLRLGIVNGKKGEGDHFT